MEEQKSVLDIYFVAFIDILGFASMVEADCESPRGSEIFLHKLKEIAGRASNFRNELADLQLVQFSDSIVVAHPYDKGKFSLFLKSIAKFQWDLFSNQILSRGGVAYGKHFYKHEFMFSQGLVEAYNLERNSARYPRIAVSTDLLDLISPSKDFQSIGYLLSEDDGISFIDYLECCNRKEIGQAFAAIVSNNRYIDPSIRE